MEISKTAKIVNEIAGLKHDFFQKIKTAEEVKKILGKRPREKTVVMCYGTFDIVHPGHIRQLIYARSKGDILVVCLTTDKYVAKNLSGPYIPQELRAINVAAFELVDYVVLDPHPTPVEIISEIQPDYYVKGFEYSTKSLSPRLKEERDALSSYGGELIYSPGDIVYSSSKLPTTNKPNLSLEQLLVLMSAEKIRFDDLHKTIKKFANLKVHIVGDLIIDKYSQCTLLGPAQKSPAFSVRLDSTDTYVGGAGVVAKHFKALGAEVIFTTVIGKDSEANFAVKDLASAGIQVNTIIDQTRPTTIKHRYYTSGNRLLLQVDSVDNHAISEEIMGKISQKIRQTKSDAVICSDFRHGIFNAETVRRITESIPKNTLKVADSQVSNRWGNILDFVNFDLITPNEREARFALGDQDTTIRPLAQMLYNKASCRYLILKLGGNGIMVYRSPGMESREFFYVNTFVEGEPVDAIGAGDALLAATTSALVISQDIVQASILGNMCAAIACSKMGNVPVTAKELLNMLDALENKF